MPEPRLNSVSVWRLTALGLQLNAQGRMNARHFEAIPNAYVARTWALISLNTYCNNSQTVVTLLNQFSGPHGYRVRIPLDTWDTYVTNQWIRRVDVADLQRLMPVKSVWKITPAFTANIPAPHNLLAPDTLWMVQSLNLSPNNCMAQCIRLLNLTQYELNGERHMPRYQADMICEYALDGWLERVDVGWIDLD